LSKRPKTTLTLAATRRFLGSQNEFAAGALSQTRCGSLQRFSGPLSGLKEKKEKKGEEIRRRKGKGNEIRKRRKGRKAPPRLISATALTPNAD